MTQRIVDEAEDIECEDQTTLYVDSLDDGVAQPIRMSLYSRRVNFNTQFLYSCIR